MIDSDTNIKTNSNIHWNKKILIQIKSERFKVAHSKDMFLNVLSEVRSEEGGGREA